MFEKSKVKTEKAKRSNRKKTTTKYIEREDGKVLCPNCAKKGGEKWVERNSIKFGMCEACRDDLKSKYEPVLDKAVGVRKVVFAAIGAAAATAIANAVKEKISPGSNQNESEYNSDYGNEDDED